MLAAAQTIMKAIREKPIRTIKGRPQTAAGRAALDGNGGLKSKKLSNQEQDDLRSLGQVRFREIGATWTKFLLSC